MKRYALPILFSCVLILYASPVMAAPVDVTVQPSDQAGLPYSVMKFDMTIANNQDYDDVFQIVISGDHMEWNMPSLIAKNVRSHSSGQTELVFNPTGTEKGSFMFTASAISVRNPDVKGSADFYIDMPFDFTVESLSSSYSGGTVSFSAVLHTGEGKAVQGEFGLKDDAGRMLGEVPFTETVDGNKTIARALTPAEKLSAGTYTIYISSGNQTVDSSTLSVQAVRSVVQKVEEASLGFSKVVTISVTNDGTVIEKDYSFEQTMPLDLMTGMLTKPADNCAIDGGEMACSYHVGEIKPGATAYVTYTVSYWPAFNGYMLLAAIVAGLVLFSFVRTTTPRIYKDHTRKGEGVHNIYIQVKNPFFHKMNDVMVRDWISPLAQVLHEEIESTKPVMRGVDEGTELIWKLGEMKPREERILQYKVRSLVKGTLKMPGAQLKFTTGKGEKRIKLSSNGITIA